MTAPEITEEDITEFSEKLTEFGNGLSPRQQALLGMILARSANEDGEDVEGQGLFTDPLLAHHILHSTIVEWTMLQPHLHTLISHVAQLHHVTPVPSFGAQPQ